MLKWKPVRASPAPFCLRLPPGFAFLLRALFKVSGFPAGRLIRGMSRGRRREVSCTLQDVAAGGRPSAFLSSPLPLYS